jgi:hypothetical protein
VAAFTRQRWGLRLCVAIVLLVAAATVRGDAAALTTVAAACALAVALARRAERALLVRVQRWQLEDTRLWGDGESTHVARFSARFDRAWREWGTLRVGAKALVLGDASRTCLVIPLRAFRDEDELAQFIALAARSVALR